MDDNEPQAQSFLIFSVVLGLGAIALLLGWFLGPDPRDLVPAWRDISGIAWGCGLGVLAALPMLLLVFLVEQLPWAAVKQLQEATEEKLVKLMAGFTYAELAAVSLCAGVGEEMLFRGWLFMHLAGPMAQWQTPVLAAAVFASSLAFGLAHPISPLYIIITGLIGVYLALLMIWTENLLVPVAAHAFYDFVQLVIATRQFRRANQ